MDGMELKFSYLHYQDGNLLECVKILERTVNKKLGQLMLSHEDLFFRTLIKEIFKSVILNSYFHNREIFEDDLKFLFNDINSVKDNVLEFYINFCNTEFVSFKPYFNNITDKMLENALHIIIENLV